ncbi:MAG: molybdopterin synthase catalytic subunit [Gammaproteobacteria bacterium]|jgi:molybdopterin synthase catalytic subunit
MQEVKISIQNEPFDVAAVIDNMRSSDPGVGAIASFVGVCRDINDGAGVSDMTLEHYPGMTERAIESIVEQARQRWSLRACEVIHRVGQLAPTELIVLVAVASAHRGDAFAACEFIMDFLKTEAPFWKKETTPQGERWVDARSSDTQALERWRS